MEVACRDSDALQDAVGAVKKLVAIALLLGGCGTTDTKQTLKAEAQACFICWGFSFEQEVDLTKQIKPKGKGEDDGR